MLFINFYIFSPIKTAKLFFTLLLVVTGGALFLSACTPEKKVFLSGETMGTVYHITLISERYSIPKKIHQKIEARLKEINAHLSNYIETSELSRFNATSRDQEVLVSPDLAAMIRLGHKLHTISAGAWDGTIWPLVTAWGFNRPDQQTSVPSPQSIKKALECVDFSLIKIEGQQVSKKRSSLFLDFGSIAKGYGVDQIAQLLRGNNIKNFVVEIGGEVYASGVKQDEGQWIVGINTPRENSSLDEVYQVLWLTDRAVATSGDYRNFFTIKSKRYSHVLDPRTGYPVAGDVVGASVVAGSCALADGLATALMVMGPEKGLKGINHLENVECLIITADKNKKLKNHFSKNFKDLVAD